MRNEAQVCPVCRGAGEVWRSDPLGSINVLGGYYVVCHGCGGSGWVAVLQPEADTPHVRELRATT